MAGKGLTKRHSALQKAHYETYKRENRAKKNKIARLKARVRKNEAMAKRKARRDPPREVKPDQGAINALKALGAT